MSMRPLDKILFLTTLLLVGLKKRPLLLESLRINPSIPLGLKSVNQSVISLQKETTVV